ncbi:MAG TPA: hypothetical protein VMK84_34150 [Streptosporangiaceae bacterium]|nr:hypothetical protein [Streptosporangiaceae bacterium]
MTASVPALQAGASWLTSPRLAAAGLTKGFVSKLERDLANVSVASLIRLCDAHLHRRHGAHLPGAAAGGPGPGALGALPALPDHGIELPPTARSGVGG